MRVRTLRLPFDLKLALPGSKSEAQRAIVAACLARGRTTILDATACDDVKAIVDGLRVLGFQAEWFDQGDGVLTVDGGLPDPMLERREAVIDCGRGAAPMRFLAAVAALCPGTWTLTGTPRLRERSMAPLCAALRALGAVVEDCDGRAPLTIHGGTLHGDAVDLDASGSSQHLSALLLIGATLPRGLRISLAGRLASRSYADLTARVLTRFQADIDVQGSTWSIGGGGLESPGDLRIEGDWSAAGALLSLARITRSRFVGSNLRFDSAQGDRMVPILLEELSAEGDVTIDLADTPDQAPNLVIAALFRNGDTRLVGAPQLRDKESDRIATLCAELGRTGARVEPTDDGYLVHGGHPLVGAALSCHDDHRLAMAFAILGSVVDGIEIDDPGCVTKSYPRFFDDLALCAHSARAIALVGMRGAGKSTLAPALAEALSLECVDTDREFELAHGPIDAFVQRQGWSAFRAHEAAIVPSAVVPGRVVAVGGGAIESPAVERLLHERALVVWLQEDVATLVERLRHSNRPSLSELPLADEVREVLARREPAYAAVATTTLHGGDIGQRVAAVMAWLRAPWLAHRCAESERFANGGGCAEEDDGSQQLR